MKVWSVAVGNINPLQKASRDAVKYISKLKGFVGFYPHYPDGVLCFFRSENDAKRARNLMDAEGIHSFACGYETKRAFTVTGALKNWNRRATE